MFWASAIDFVDPQRKEEYRPDFHDFEVMSFMGRRI